MHWDRGWYSKEKARRNGSWSALTLYLVFTPLIPAESVFPLISQTYPMSLVTLHLAQYGAGFWASSPARAAVGGAVTVAFALLGRVVRGVSFSGAFAGGLICLILLCTAGPGGFLVLFSLFVVTWIATRLGRSRKQTLGTAERREGRTASQVLANLSVAALCGLLYAVRIDAVWLIAMVAAMAEVATDTVASECGQAFSREARLITNFQRVPAGTDGGISIAGTAFGIGAGLVVGLVGVMCGLVPMRWLWLPVVAGLLGMLADSVLGAWLERRRWLNNEQVNLTGTVIAALIAVISIGVST
jgi:uncharacterized protein (TIGR00297 family)